MNVHEFGKPYAAFIRRKRLEAGMSQLELSIEMGGEPKYIWRLENNKMPFYVDDLMAIVRILDLDPNETAVGIMKIFEACK